MSYAIADGWYRRRGLIAESRAAEQRGIEAEGRILRAEANARQAMRTAREALPAPEIPLPSLDPIVFGDFGPTPWPEPSYLVWHRCDEHQTSWRGDGACWACEP